jgi:hypothetical protein
MAKSCVISAVGKNSFHKNWMDPLGEKFDLHLLVYDNSYSSYQKDTPFVSRMKGQKFRAIYRYLKRNKMLLDDYDYYYIPDDDIFIDDVNIKKLFHIMSEYNLAIAQPALTNSYFSYGITLRKEESILRYTNFVEMMQPCFSNDALNKVLFTFNENLSGWGMDFHWPSIVDCSKGNMAIIDYITSIHTRPIGKNYKQEINQAELNSYLKKYNLTIQIGEFERVSHQRTLHRC